MRPVSALYALAMVAVTGLPAQAFCRSYIEDGTAAGLRYSYVCENTYAAPRYLIIRQFIGGDEQAFFEFAPDDIALLCSSGSFSGRSFSDCHSYTPASLPDAYDGGIGPVRLHPLSAPDQETDTALAEAFSAQAIFRYPEDPALVAGTGCAVTVSDRRALDLYFRAEDPGALAECLLNFELFATENWKDLIVR